MWRHISAPPRNLASFRWSPSIENMYVLCSTECTYIALLLSVARQHELRCNICTYVYEHTLSVRAWLVLSKENWGPESFTMHWLPYFLNKDPPSRLLRHGLWFKGPFLTKNQNRINKKVRRKLYYFTLFYGQSKFLDGKQWFFSFPSKFFGL